MNKVVDHYNRSQKLQRPPLTNLLPLQKFHVQNGDTTEIILMTNIKQEAPSHNNNTWKEFGMGVCGGGDIILPKEEEKG